jgi:hypothetical protein
MTAAGETCKLVSWAIYCETWTALGAMSGSVDSAQRALVVAVTTIQHWIIQVGTGTPPGTSLQAND